MTARSSAALSGPIRGLTAAIAGMPAALRSPLSPALSVATAAAALLAIGPALTIAAADGASAQPVFTAGPLLAVLAVAPVAAAWLLAGNGRTAAAAGLLGALGVQAAGRAVMDSQLLFEPWLAARPELFAPTSLAGLSAGPGAAVLLTGHLLHAVAGLLALSGLLRARAAAGGGQEHGQPRPAGLAVALSAGMLAAAGLVLSRPFGSTDPYLAPKVVADAPTPTMLGVLLLAAGTVLVAGLAASAADPGAAGGGLAGAAAGVAAVVLPPLAAAAASETIGVTPGPPVALAGAAALGAAGWLVTRPARAGSANGAGSDASSPSAVSAVSTDVSTEARLPPAHVLIRVAGGLAVLSGLAGLLGAAGRQVVIEQLPQFVVYPARLLYPAGALLVVLGALLLAPHRIAAVARPALSAGWAAMALAAAATLDLVLNAAQLDGATAGYGAWLTGLALLCALAAGIVAAVAGSVDRDEVDLTELAERTGNRWLRVAGWSAAAMAVPGFGLPLVRADGYQPAGLWSRFEVASWGLVAAVAAVVVAGLLAAYCRPSLAFGLLLGAAAVVAVHLSAVPLVGGRGADQVSLAPGALFAAGCGLALLTGAGLASRPWLTGPQLWREQPRDRPGRGTGKYAARSGRGSTADRRPVRYRQGNARRNDERSNPRGRRKARP